MPCVVPGTLSGLKTPMHGDCNFLMRNPHRSPPAIPIPAGSVTSEVQSRYTKYRATIGREQGNDQSNAGGAGPGGCAGS